MIRHWMGTLLAALAMGASTARADEPIAPETFTVETALKPGPNIFVASPGWFGPSVIHVFSASDLSYKGNYTNGLNGQMAFGAGGTVGYTASNYPKRIMRGPIEAVLERFDVATLKTTGEVIIPPKFAPGQALQGMIQVSADGERAFVQNATPATSVTVVNLKSGKVVSEIPTPGCWTINLSQDGTRFTTLCGDGRFLTVRLGRDGRATGQAYSEKIFDPEKDPLFVHAERVGADLVFVSYSGVFHRVSDAGDTARLVGAYAVAKDLPGGWAPGGYELMGYNAPNGILFISMHPGAKDGSHKNGSTEVWAVDLERRAIVSRSVAPGLTHLAVSQDKAPVIFGVNSHGEGLFRYETNPAAGFAARLTHQTPLRNASYLLAP